MAWRVTQYNAAVVSVFVFDRSKIACLYFLIQESEQP